MYSKWWKLHNPEKVAAGKRRWRDEHRDVARRIKRNFYRNHSRLIIEKVTAWSAANPERAKAIKKKSYQNNRNVYLAKSKKLYALNRETRIQEQKVRRCSNPEKYRACQRSSYAKKAEYYRNRTKEWVRKNPERFLAGIIRRQKRVAAVTPNPEEVARFIIETRKSPNVFCWYCGLPLSGKSIHMDHIQAIINGGLNTVANLSPSCPLCNLTKNDRPLSDWFGDRPLFYEI